MASTYPGSAIDTFTQVTDLVTVVKAADINPVYDAVTAIETTLGTGINYAYAGTSAFDPNAGTGITPFTNVKLRLDNIERGLKYGNLSHNAPSGTVALTLKNQASGNTSDLLQTQASGTSTVAFKVDKSGIPYVGTNAVLYADTVNNAPYATIKTDISTLQSQYTSLNTTLGVVQVMDPLFLAGM